MYRDPDFEHAEALARTGFWGRSAVGVLFVATSTGHVGLTLRSQEVLEPGTFGIAGGAVDPREDKRIAAAREVREELGLNINASALVPLDVFVKGSFTYTTFLCVLPVEVPPCRLNWENDDFSWFNLRALPLNLHPGLAATLAKPKVLTKIRQWARYGKGQGGVPSCRRRVTPGAGVNQTAKRRDR